jgi:hypothetical protein
MAEGLWEGGHATVRELGILQIVLYPRTLFPRGKRGCDRNRPTYTDRFESILGVCHRSKDSTRGISECGVMFPRGNNSLVYIPHSEF